MLTHRTESNVSHTVADDDTATELNAPTMIPLEAKVAQG